MGQVSKQIGVTGQTCYQWRKAARATSSATSITRPSVATSSSNTVRNLVTGVAVGAFQYPGKLNCNLAADVAGTVSRERLQ